MKGKITTLAVLIAVVSTMLLLTACGNDSSKIVGQWERNEGKGIQELEFFSDGTYTSDHPNYNGNYSIDGNRLKLAGILVDPLVYSFEIKSNELILTPNDGEIRIFSKIE